MPARSEASHSKQQNADLVKKGQDVKTSFRQLSADVEKFLKTKVPRIPNDASRKKAKKLNAQKIAEIQQINKTIADKHKSIMADLSSFCEDMMGKPPGKYAVVKMGSLARQEITPSFDFEHAIVLINCKNYEDHLEYFR